MAKVYGSYSSDINFSSQKKIELPKERKEAKPYQGQQYEAIKKQLMESGQLFEDDMFPAENGSYYAKNGSGITGWLRPSVILNLGIFHLN